MRQSVREWPLSTAVLATHSPALLSPFNRFVPRSDTARRIDAAWLRAQNHTRTCAGLPGAPPPRFGRGHSPGPRGQFPLLSCQAAWGLPSYSGLCESCLFLLRPGPWCAASPCVFVAWRIALSVYDVSLASLAFLSKGAGSVHAGMTSYLTRFQNTVLALVS